MPAGAAHPLSQAARYGAHSHWCGHCPQLRLVAWVATMLRLPSPT